MIRRSLARLRAGCTRTERGRGLALVPSLVLLALASCATGGLTWRDQSEDPSPSGALYLRSYKEEYYRSLGRRFVGGCSTDDLIDRMRDSRVVFLGDHHTDEELHARHLRVLDELHAAGVRLAIGLEAVGEEDRTALDQYLDGAIDLDELTAAVAKRWPDSWLGSQRLDSQFYRAVLERARRRGARVFPLEPIPRLPLELRDPLIADSIRATAAEHPDRVVVCIVGHAHLLGRGRLVGRVDLESVAVGARLSRTLELRWRNRPKATKPEVVFTDRGIAFFTDLLD